MPGARPGVGRVLPRVLPQGRGGIFGRGVHLRRVRKDAQRRLFSVSPGGGVRPSRIGAIGTIDAGGKSSPGAVAHPAAGRERVERHLSPLSGGSREYRGRDGLRRLPQEDPPRQDRSVPSIARPIGDVGGRFGLRRPESIRHPHSSLRGGGRLEIPTESGIAIPSRHHVPLVRIDVSHVRRAATHPGGIVRRHARIRDGTDFRPGRFHGDEHGAESVEIDGTRRQPQRIRDARSQLGSGGRMRPRLRRFRLYDLVREERSAPRERSSGGYQHGGAQLLRILLPLD
mmetsp:Transcript_16895/g.48787  ORF Transcript_16895/g.48787 Transcript_16895/m.48787 type:complete len:285 (+) Transcript_16895:1780-2634(+)